MNTKVIYLALYGGIREYRVNTEVRLPILRDRQVARYMDFNNRIDWPRSSEPRYLARVGLLYFSILYGGMYVQTDVMLWNHNINYVARARLLTQTHRFFSSFSKKGLSLSFTIHQVCNIALLLLY